MVGRNCRTTDAGGVTKLRACGAYDVLRLGHAGLGGVLESRNVRSRQMARGLFSGKWFQAIPMFGKKRPHTVRIVFG